MPAIKSVGIVYNSRTTHARELADRLEERLGRPRHAWTCAAIEAETVADRMAGTDLIITVGGDGTILRAVHVAAPRDIAVLGINLGRVGFMTEIHAGEALTSLDGYLDGDGVWMEERMMLAAERVPPGEGSSAPGVMGPWHALNDVVVGRGAVSRIVRVHAAIDGVHLTTIRADAVIVATPTGSTGYAFAVGGPILHPLASDLVIKAVAPHISFSGALVVPSTSVIELAVYSDHAALLSVDGYMDQGLPDGEVVRVQQSPYRARFLRKHPPSYFYTTVRERLGLENDDEGRPQGPGA